MTFNLRENGQRAEMMCSRRERDPRVEMIRNRENDRRAETMNNQDFVRGQGAEMMKRHNHVRGPVVEMILNQIGNLSISTSGPIPMKRKRMKTET